MQVMVLAERWQWFRVHGVRAAMRQWPESPGDWTRQEQVALQELPITRDEIHAVLAHAPAMADDTHPGLAERCAALGVEAAAVSQVQPDPSSFAGGLLGALWVEAVGERDRRWQAVHRRRWAMDHAAARVWMAHCAQLREQAIENPERWRLEHALGERVDAAL